MTTLLRINDDLLAFRALVEECDGELTPDADAALTGWFAELVASQDDKLDAYGALLQEWTLRAAARRAEIERLQIRVRVDEANVRRLKDRLLQYLDAQEIRTLETERYKFTACQNGGREPVQTPADAKSLPLDYQVFQVSPNVEAIRDALKRGEKVEGCQLMPRGRHLRLS